MGNEKFHGSTLNGNGESTFLQDRSFFSLFPRFFRGNCTALRLVLRYPPQQTFFHVGAGLQPVPLRVTLVFAFLVSLTGAAWTPE